MSWALPARCETTATELQKKALLMGPAFKVNTEEAQEPAAAPAKGAPAPAESPADAPAAEPAPADAPK
jgi:hypothetical protein